MRTDEQIAAAVEQMSATVTFDCYDHRRGEYEMTLTAPVLDVDAEALTLAASDEDGNEARIAWDRITKVCMARGCPVAE